MIISIRKTSPTDLTWDEKNPSDYQYRRIDKTERPTMPKTLTPQEVDKLITGIELELQLMNETERECQPGGKPPDRMISFDQHVGNTSRLYRVVLTLRAAQKEAERLKLSINALVCQQCGTPIDKQGAMIYADALERLETASDPRIAEVLNGHLRELASLKSDKERLEKEVSETNHALSIANGMIEGFDSTVASLRSELEEYRKSVRENCFISMDDLTESCIHCSKESNYLMPVIERHKPNCIVLKSEEK